MVHMGSHRAYKRIHYKLITKNIKATFCSVGNSQAECFQIWSSTQGINQICAPRIFPLEAVPIDSPLGERHQSTLNKTQGTEISAHVYRNTLWEISTHSTSCIVGDNEREGAA